MSDLISRQAAIDALNALHYNDREDWCFVLDTVEFLPPVQPEIVRCKDCKYWNIGSCECREHAVNCQDYYVGDIETEAEHFCGYAERKEVTT